MDQLFDLESYRTRPGVGLTIAVSGSDGTGRYSFIKSLKQYAVSVEGDRCLFRYGSHGVAVTFVREGPALTTCFGTCMRHLLRRRTGGS